MSDLSIRSAQTVPDLTSTQSTSTEADKKAAAKAAEAKRHASNNPLDIIDTSATASSYLSSLNSQLSITNPEQERDFDQKQLKAAEKQLQLLKILGAGLSPEEFAKQTTDLAKQIAGIAKDYAANSGGSSSSVAAPSSSAAAPSVTSDAATTAQQADSAAQGAAAGKTADTSASQASSTTTPAAAAPTASSANASTSSTSTSSSTSNSATAGNSASSASSASSTSSTTGSTASTAATTAASLLDPDAAQPSTPNSFFSEVESDFKELKKLETRAISQLNLSPDKKKKDEAKKLGGEFNEAVNSTAASANAAGAAPSIGAAIAGQSIDLSKVAINLTA